MKRAIQYKNGNGDTTSVSVNDRNQADIHSVRVAVRRISGPVGDRIVLSADDRKNGEITVYDGQTAVMIIA
jgi:hypothetical protein